MARGHRPFTPAEATSREMFAIKPSQMLVVGFDTDDGAEHELWRADARDEASPAMIASLRKRGQIAPTRVRKLPENSPHRDRGFLVEVGVGRDRTKSGRVIEQENPNFRLNCVMYAAGTKAAEFCGVANAENHVRKIESFEVRVEHMFQQVQLEGGDAAAIASCAADFGVTPVYVRQCLAFREAADVQAARSAGTISDSVALALSPLDADDRAKQLQAIVEDPTLARTDLVRERVARDKKAAKAPKAPSAPAEKHTGAHVAMTVSRSAIARIAKHCAERPSNVSREAQAVFDVLCGKQPPSTVEGLVEVMHAAKLL